MKVVKNFIIIDFIVLLIKVLGGILCSSKTMLASAVLDISLIISGLIVCNSKENKKYKGIISSIIGLVIIILSLLMIFYSIITDIKKTSLLILIFIILSLIIRYIAVCFQTNASYQRKKGLLTYAKLNSTIDFVSYGVILGALILMKISKWVKILKYADILGTIIISGFAIYKGIKIISKSIKYLENKDEDKIDEYIEEIKTRKEVKKVEKLEVLAYGGIKNINCNLILNDGISVVDVNTFVITLQDYLLKFSDSVKISLVQKVEPKRVKVKVRSKKADARNSGSRNSKTNPKRKNSKQKNKRR